MLRFPLFLVLQWLAIELALAAFFHFHQDYDAEMWKYTRDIKLNVSDARSHVHRPNASAQLMGVELRTNSVGLRGLAAAMDLRSFRLLTIGDSFTLGWGVSEEASYPRLLEKKLECKKLQALNGGIGNYNLEQVTAFLREQGLALQPSAILYGFYWNDAEPVQREPESYWERYSYISLYWRKVKTRIFHYQLEPESYLTYYEQTFRDESRLRFEAKARELVALAKSRNLPLYVALLPELRSAGNPRIKAIYENVQSVFLKEGARVVNLFDALPQKENMQEWWVSKDDPHPNALAHEQMASLIVQSFWGRDCAAEPGKL